MVTRSRGFSLIELMVAMVITLVLGIAVAALFKHLTQQSGSQKDSVDIQRTLRTAMFLINRDLANAGYLLRCTTNTDCATFLTTVPTAGTPIIAVASNPPTLTINYAAPTIDDPVQIIYSIESDNGVRSLRRVQKKAGATNNIQSDTFIAPNIIAMSFMYGTSTGGHTTILPTDTFTLRSIKVSLLARSAFPDKNYKAPSTINLFTETTSTITYPCEQNATIITCTTGNYSNYRHEVLEQEVQLINTDFSSI